MAIKCPPCGAEYDVTLFTFGRSIHCDCGAWVWSPNMMDRLQGDIVGLARPKPSKKPKAQSEIASDTLFQFKITLMESEPPIWRRIQVKDCTLDKLHEHIQTAMGWTNSHLHEFEINGQRHGDPDLLDDGFEDFECIDSTKTIISDIVPEGRKRFAFRYEYDFGDGWEHEDYLKVTRLSKRAEKYPLCLEGEQACPPEDGCGVWGCADAQDL